MNEYAPSAIHWLANGIIVRVPSAEMSGIVGDPNHTYGYHRARNVLPSGDYSVQTSPDKQGDGWAASALDIKMNSTQMKLVTKRLLASAKSSSDNRLRALREFFGTTNGSTVAGWDVYYDRAAYSDDSSHTWHIHMSILRKYANDKQALAGVLSVIIGEEDDDMELTDQVKLGAWVKDLGSDLGNSLSVATLLGSGYGHAREAKQLIRNEVLAGQAAILAKVSGADLPGIKTAMRAELDRAAAAERTERANELADLAGPLAAAIGAQLDHELDVASVEAAIRSVFGGLDGE